MKNVRDIILNENKDQEDAWMNKEELKSMELNDLELENVNGGVSNNQKKSGQEKQVYCPHCKKITWFNLGSGGRAVCQDCGNQIMI